MTDPWRPRPQQNRPDPGRDRGQTGEYVQWPAGSPPQPYRSDPSVPADQASWGYPSAPYDGGADPVLVTIGDIAVTKNWVITPNGTRPIGTVQWIFTDNTRTTERMPAYAIVLAIVFFLVCLLGLLFLLIKERRMEGFVQVTVQGQGLYHVVQIPAASQQEIAHLHNLVGYARSVSAHAAGR